MIQRQVIDKQQFLAICEEGTLITQSRLGPKIIESPSGNIIKFFWPRKIISRSRIQSPAKRFIKNALKLQNTGFHGVDVKTWLHCSDPKVECIVYAKLPGKDFRQTNNKNKLAEVARFVANLHSQGIFFRGIHLGNLLQCANNKIALLDITDCKVYKKPLGFHKRYRNLRHLLANQDDQNDFKQFGIDKFIDIYLNQANIDLFRKKRLKYLLRGIQTEISPHSTNGF